MKHMSVSLIAAMLLLNLWKVAVGADIGSAAGFDQSPRLRQAMATEQLAYFTVTIPENAGEELSQLSFSDFAVGKDPGKPAQIPFDLAQTNAFLGTPETVGRAIPLDGAWVDETGVVWVGFTPALPPGTTFTVALAVLPELSSGSRDYGIAAYPDAPNPIPAFVGDRTLVFP